jgi:hypothetical protein
MNQRKDCPHDVVCQTCPRAADDDVCFPRERLQAELEWLRSKIQPRDQDQ